MAGTALTLSEAAEALGISIKAVRSRVERGSIPHTLGPDGLRRVPTSVIEQLITSNAAPARYSGAIAASQGASDEVLTALIDRIAALETAVAENGRLLELTERVEDEKTALELKVFELSAQLKTLESQLETKSRWWKRSRPAQSISTLEQVPQI